MAWPPPPTPGYLPSARPYEASPTPPPVRAPPPYYQGPWAPPAPPHGAATREAIQQIRDAIGYYWAYLVLDLVVGFVGLLALGAAYGSGFGLVDTSGTLTTTPPLSGGRPWPPSGSSRSRRSSGWPC